MSLCAGYFHHAGSVDVDEARPVRWWPTKTAEGDERLKLWEAFQARYAALAVEERQRRRQAQAAGQALKPNRGERKLTPSDRTVFNVLLFGFMNRKSGQCDPSQAEISDKTGLHRATVARALRRLLAFGFLNWERRKALVRQGPVWFMGQASNFYRFLRASMSQNATGTPVSNLIGLALGKPARNVWTERLQYRLRQVREEEQARAKMIERMLKLQPELL